MLYGFIGTDTGYRTITFFENIVTNISRHERVKYPAKEGKPQEPAAPITTN